MAKARKGRGILLSGLLAAAGCCTTDAVDVTPPPALPVTLSPTAPASTAAPDLPAAPVAPLEDRPLAINLPTALKLANAQAVTIAAATEQIQAAVAALQLARAQWLPSVTVGGDYYGHAGPIQDVSNVVFNDSHGSLMLGAGVGIGPAAVFTLTDAIFAPLAARQQVNASQANRQAAANDTLVAVTEAYFTVQQARGELGGAMETTRRAEDLVARTRKLAPQIVPELELFRAETELARRHEAESSARERWKVASAELLRVLRLDPAARVQPTEPPQLRVNLIDLNRRPEELIAIALTSRPELASRQAEVQQTLALLKQERWRPLLPSVVLSGPSTPGSNLGVGGFLPYPNGNVSGARADVNVQVLWQLNNLGVGNAALIHEREAANRLANVEVNRIQDLVASEVMQAYAQAQEANRRVEWAEKGLRAGLQSADRNLEALSKTKGIGPQLVTVVRPQEAVAAVQSLAQAYVDYYGAVADANRAQFRLYRALGQPAQHLAQEEELCGPPAPSDAAPQPPADRLPGTGKDGGSQIQPAQ